ncbi:MAG: G-protein chaperone required for conversion of methylmalonyl-CoA to succinyl-CoA [Planctomycetota bacterium]
MRPAAPTVDAVLAGDRRALARAITLVESRLEADQQAAEELLAALLPHSGKALRIGITGAPGVGKSTFIETLGTRLCDRGHKVAVLAVDPSSAVSGGSILGDKTRMAELGRHPNAYIRPTPGGDVLGGVAAHTREAMLVCEAAGFDTVLVETIGTGQSETAVAAMVDVFLLLLSPAAGDELQGIKRGVMELADAIVVHKADGDLLPAAERAKQQCLVAVHILRGGDVPPVVLASSQTGSGVDEAWQAVLARVESSRQSGRFGARRAEQSEHWLHTALQEALLRRFEAVPQVQAALPGLVGRVRDGSLVPAAAVRQLLRLGGLG